MFFNITLIENELWKESQKGFINKSARIPMEKLRREKFSVPKGRRKVLGEWKRPIP